MKQILIAILFLPFIANAQLTIKESIPMEYWKVLHGNDDSLYGYYGSSVPVCLTRSLGKLIKKASGGFNRIRAVTTDGNFYNSRQYNEPPTPMAWFQVPTDTTGAAFSDNTYVAAYADVYFTIRSNGTIWYGGDDRFHLFYLSGTAQMRPTQISPAGIVFTKVSIGYRILALSREGDVYQWSMGNRNPIKISLPRPAIDIAASWYDAQFAILQKSIGSAYGEPYVWGGAWGTWGSAVAQSYTTPVNLTVPWGVTSLIKEICVTRQSIHYIDSLHRMFCPASYNVQGEGGFGLEWVNRYTYPSYPGGGWTFGDWQNPTTAPAVQVGIGIQWQHLYATNWYGFYKDAVSVDGKLYGCGRNKTNVMRFGHIYSPNQNDSFPNDFDRSSWTEQTQPFTKAVKTYRRVSPKRGAGINRTITINSTTLAFTGNMVLAVNGTDTTRGRVVGHTWTKKSGPVGDTSKIVCPTCSSTAVTGLRDGTYVYQDLTVDDFKGQDTSQVQIIVKVVTTPPAGGSSLSENHDFLTYDSAIYYKINQWDSARFSFRISRPKILDGRAAIITVPGKGEQGVDPAKLQVWGPHFWLNNGWDGGVMLGNGKHYPILITMIFREGNSYPNFVMWDSVISRLARIYHFNPEATYLMGLSYGSWVASGVPSVPGEKNITAFVALSGAGTSGADYKRLGHWAKEGGKGFLTVGYQDYGNDIEPPKAVKAMQDSSAGSVFYTYNNVANGTHGGWNDIYNPANNQWWSGKFTTTKEYQNSYKDGSNIYQWALRQGDTTLSGTIDPPPVVIPVNKYPVPAIAPILPITAPTAWAVLDGSASYDPDGAIDSTAFNQVSGPSPARILSVPRGLTAVAVGLQTGTYIFNLQVWDNYKASSQQLVSVIVNPAPITAIASIPLSFTILGTIIGKTITVKSDGTYLIQ